MNEICVRSIMEIGFNERYSKVYKYAKQCYTGTRWHAPDEFPVRFTSVPEVNSWPALRKFILAVGPATPEVLIPPELLYPWESPTPTDVEYLLEEGSECKLDKSIIQKILDELIVEPKKILTTTDFVLAQTNTHRCHKAPKAKKLEALGKSAMSYKYETIVEWVDAGCPQQEPIALRTPVWKRTTEYRDAISLNPCTLYQVWELNSYLKFSINSKAVGDYWDNQDLANFSRRHKSFILTDWKKSGLTIPHWFCEMVVETLSKKCPQYSGVFPVNGIRIYDPEKKVWFHNDAFGYGLGMCNNVYTLLNITLFKYAQEIGVFDETDEIVSFNDDSAIGTSISSKYERWLNICRRSGGYLDEHKTVQGPMLQFCEMYVSDYFKNNFKWVSTFNTILRTVPDCINLVHWRFQCTEAWDAVRGYSSQTPEVPNDHFIGTITHYALKAAEAFYGVEIENELDPCFGGVCIGSYLRTPYMLKTTLLSLSEAKDKDFYYKFACLKVIKEHEASLPKFRPWKKIPSGACKDRMAILGGYTGLNHELTAFKQRANNEFNTNTDWFKYTYWTTLEEKLAKIDMDSCLVRYDPWDWIAEHRWPACAIPKELASGETVANLELLPFVRIQKTANRYTLPSQLVALIDSYSGEYIPEIPREERSLEGFLLWETPLLPESDCFRPMCNMETISKIADFGDPRRVFLDFWSREKVVITNLRLVDHRGLAAGKLIAALSKGEYQPRKGTWYTKIPLPLTETLEKHLHNFLPNHHSDIICVALRDNVDDEFDFPNCELPYSWIDQDMRENKKFWKNKTKARKKSERKKRSGQTLVAPGPISDQESLSLVNMDDIAELIERFTDGFLLKTQAEEDITPIEEKPPPSVNTFAFLADLPNEVPDWLNNCSSPKQEEEYDWDCEPNEDDIDWEACAALDEDNYLSDECVNWDWT